MDYILRKVPIINIAIGALVILFFGVVNLLSVSILMALALFSLSCIVYRIQTLEKNRALNSNKYFAIAILGSAIFGILVYFYFPF